MDYTTQCTDDQFRFSVSLGLLNEWYAIWQSVNAYSIKLFKNLLLIFQIWNIPYNELLLCGGVHNLPGVNPADAKSSFVSFCNGYAFKYSLCPLIVYWTCHPASRIPLSVEFTLVKFFFFFYEFSLLLFKIFLSCLTIVLQLTCQNRALFFFDVQISFLEKHLFSSSNLLYCSAVMENSCSIWLESENKVSVPLMVSFNFYLNYFFICMQFLFFTHYWISFTLTLSYKYNTLQFGMTYHCWMVLL